MLVLSLEQGLFPKGRKKFWCENERVSDSSDREDKDSKPVGHLGRQCDVSQGQDEQDIQGDPVHQVGHHQECQLHVGPRVVSLHVGQSEQGTLGLEGVHHDRDVGETDENQGCHIDDQERHQAVLHPLELIGAKTYQ